METLRVSTHSRTQLINISAQVQDAVTKSGVDGGICMVFVPHTTAAVTINENADPAVPRDMLMELDKIIPFEDGYTHAEGNSAAHMKSTLVGASCMVAVRGGRLALGTWQGIYFCEFDGPRSRRVEVTCT